MLQCYSMCHICAMRGYCITLPVSLHHYLTGSNLTSEQQVYRYLHSRAQQVTGNVFGIMLREFLKRDGGVITKDAIYILTLTSGEGQQHPCPKLACYLTVDVLGEEEEEEEEEAQMMASMY